jgi:hypothetical protein
MCGCRSVGVLLAPHLRAWCRTGDRCEHAIVSREAENVHDAAAGASPSIAALVIVEDGRWRP